MNIKTYLLALLCLLCLFSCSDDDIEPSFTMAEDSEEILFESAAGERTALHFTSTREWQASCEATWLSLSPTTGEAGEVYVIVTTTEANEGDEARTATLVLTSAGLTKHITVTQKEPDRVTPEQTEYQMEAIGGEMEIAFTTNVTYDNLSVYYYAYGNMDWLTVKPGTLTTTGEGTLLVTAQPNTHTAARTAYIYFTSGTGDNQQMLATVTFVQWGTAGRGSTDYSADGTVRVLHKATQGNGIPMVLMGDGFMDVEIAAGNYDKAMDKAYANLFTEEPVRSLLDYFDVYAVTAVSRHNQFGSGFETALGCELEGGNSTTISGNDTAVQNYVRKVEGIDLEETLAVVILNCNDYAGTTYFRYTMAGQVTEFAIAYCPIIDNLESESFRQVLTHEAIGHGFAKLQDEYAYEEMGTIPVSQIQSIRSMQAYGWAQNVDFTNDPTQVLWSTFLTDSRYAAENLGVYEGACTYVRGAYRPTEESMMNSNTTGFNAPSRKAIYDAVMDRGASLQPTYEEFVTFDLQHASGVKRAARSSAGGTFRPFAPPRCADRPLSKE